MWQGNGFGKRVIISAKLVEARKNVVIPVDRGIIGASRLAIFS